MVVKELKIWELAEKYGVTFTDSEREEIIASFLTRVVNENDFTTEVILKKAQIIMEGLSVNSSKSFHDFEYEILRSSTLDYEDRYVGEANDIICTIVNSCVSDASKKDYVYDNDIWELFEQYSVGLSKEEQVNILYRQFERLSLMNKTVPAERILKDLLPVVKALVATEHIEAKTSKKKTDKYLKQKLAQAGKELFCKAGIYGENIAEYTEYGFLFNSDHTREDVAWVFGDEKFDVLLNKLKVSIPKNDDYLDDVFLVYTYAIDNKKRAYTFFTHDHLYWVKEGKSVSSVAFKTFREVNSFGTITLKNGDSRYDVFLVKGKSDPEITDIVKAITETINQCVTMTSRKIVIIRQITEYYDLAKKKILGEVAEEFETGIANILQRNKTEKTEKESVKKATGYDVGKEENKTEKNKCNMDQSQLQTKQATKPLTTTPSITKKLSVSAYVRSLDMTCPTEHLLRQLLVHYENGISTFTFLTGTEAFAKRIVKATAAYASIESGETPLLLEDHTLFGSAKEGIVLTDKMLYYRNAIMGVKVKLPIGEIQEVTWKCQTKDLYYIEAVSQKGKFKLSSRNKEAVAVKTAEFYTDVFYLLKQLQKNKNSTNNSLEKVISVGTPGVVTPNDYWNCMCGNVCRGKFCPKCGKAKDNSVNLWTCTCGNVNKGKFCTKCGKPK